MRFSLKRLREHPDSRSGTDFTLKLEQEKKFKKHLDNGSDDEKSLLQAIRNKDWTKYSIETRLDNESNLEKQQDAAPKPSSLPVGVVRGFVSCESCQKIPARWRPEAGCRPDLDDAPVFFPLEEEFQDAVKYIASITAEAEPYGICRIVPPHSWRPPCPLKDNEKWRTAKFPTRVQRLDKLQVREARIKKEQKKRKRGRPRLIPIDVCTESSDEDGTFGFEPGPPFTLESFEKYDKQFKDEYFGLNEREKPVHGSFRENPSVDCVEGEYWRIVEHAAEQLEVLYGADIETRKFGSGFPQARLGETHSSYESSGWNLNNIARLGGSVLAFEEEEISGVLVPWLYVGMCFSSFCWHVEDHHLYSVNYMHFGSPKVWYGVPGSAALKLENAMKKHLPELFEEQPDLLHKLVTQLSPSVLKTDGVPVYRTIQRPGEFVVTFPRAYHAGFNCGFNCAEAVNVAPIDWLPAGQNAVEMYRQEKRKITVSHDKLLLGAAQKYLLITRQPFGPSSDREAVAWRELFAEHDVLSRVFKERVELEKASRRKVEEFVHIRRMDKNFDSTDAKECIVCHYDLHLSAVGCECAQERYTCLEHVHDLCPCEKSRKHALYRYEILELEAIATALRKNSKLSDDSQQLLELSAGSQTSMAKCIELKIQGFANEHSVSGSPSSNHNVMCAIDLGTSIPVENGRVCEDSLLGTQTSIANSNFSTPICLDNGQAADHGHCSYGKGPMEKYEGKEVIVLSDDEDCSDSQSDTKCPIIMDALSAVENRSNRAPTDLSNRVKNSPVGGNIFGFSHLPIIDNSRSVSSPLPLISSGNTSGKGWDRIEGLQQSQEHIKLSSQMSAIQVQKIFGSDIIPHMQSDRTVFPHTNNSMIRAFSLQRGPISSPFVQYTNSKPSPVDTISGTDWLCLGNVQISSSDPKLHNLSGTRIDLDRSRYMEEILGDDHFSDVMYDSSGAILQNSSHSPKAHLKVELLQAGSIVLGMPWCNKDAIFPAGFRSRVIFTSILDPCKMCFYISEISDLGHREPVFKVTMEEHPDEVFVSASIDRCWQMVQEKVNVMIELHHNSGKVGLPPLQPPEDVRGLELFGFTSPHIVKAVESLDWQHQCLEYWAGRISAVALLRSQHQEQTATIVR
ncbi:hypothetical protein KP509_28G058700 [Ceratopteris richardii]|nr:hypothetical protein KP509_28G058700 [Ceratopteris richardii]KAH7294152.1 hypothetical protein KP509_28G058700 [Ceratopteris richardii]KAH7294154.1 hypothetical protein KP509_28G058700 [Ceratopteris richardii]